MTGEANNLKNTVFQLIYCRYGNFSVEGEHVNGQQTLGENIAGGYFGTLDHSLALRIFLNTKNIPGGYFISWPTEFKLDLCSTE